MKHIFFSALFVYLAACNSPHSKRETLTTLPAFNILLIDGVTTLYAQEIPIGSPIILFFFRPDCPHCQQETTAILNHMDALKNVRFYLISIEPLKKIKEFYLNYHLDQYKNFIIGQDNDYTFINLFRPESIPYLAIYDSNKKLIKVYSGSIGIDKILAATHT